MQLEPSDIIILKRHHDEFGKTTIRGNLDHVEIGRENTCRQALALTGCIELGKDDDFSEGFYVDVTKLGVDVLNYLSAWKPETENTD